MNDPSIPPARSDTESIQYWVYDSAHWGGSWRIRAKRGGPLGRV